MVSSSLVVLPLSVEEEEVKITTLIITFWIAYTRGNI